MEALQVLGFITSVTVTLLLVARTGYTVATDRPEAGVIFAAAVASIFVCAMYWSLMP